ncbi:ribosome biogenesis protein Nop16 [Biscogniauxia mediterranea]|nr:ribosome biogenesis protein Nop16 [Biscogniauxia mediterranea]
MGRDLQKRKRRSSRPAVRQPSSSRLTKHLLNPLGNSIVARNWNKKETTTQNYRRLGLVARLRAPTGGVEPVLSSSSTSSSLATPKSRRAKPTDPFAIDPGTGAVVREARVERDASGRIVRVLDEISCSSSKKKHSRPNPLNDPLVALDSSSSEAEEEEDEEEWGGIDDDGTEKKNDIVRQLEAEAARPVEKRPRAQSAREVEWLRRLVGRHGDDTRAMARDRRLNPMQQTEADIARRIRKWKGEEREEKGAGA